MLMSRVGRGKRLFQQLPGPVDQAALMKKDWGWGWSGRPRAQLLLDSQSVVLGVPGAKARQGLV